MMKYRPTILAEEYFPGYWWELRRMNSRVSVHANPLTGAFTSLSHHQIRENDVAALAGIPLAQLIRDHSLGHYRKVGWQAFFWRRQAYRKDFLDDGFKLPRVLKFCRACSEEDVSFHGRAYYRRSHQMPGVNWCQKHDFQKLLWTPSTHAGVTCPPDEWAGLSENADVPRWGDLSPCLKRFMTEFIESCEDALMPGYFVDVDVLRSRWEKLQIQLSMNGHSLLIRSRTLTEHPTFDGLEIPYKWLNSNFRYWQSTLHVDRGGRLGVTMQTACWLIRSTLAGVCGAVHPVRDGRSPEIEQVHSDSATPTA